MEISNAQRTATANRIISERSPAIKRFCCLLVLIGLLVNGPAKARAAIILESATYGGSKSGGSALGSTSQILGARFVLTTTVAVDHIGGNIEEGLGAAGLFGAIVKLANDPSAVPAPDWASNGSVQAATVFHSSTPSTDILVPLSVVLVPGEYALMFGSDHFGATGNGDMPTNNPFTAQASFFLPMMALAVPSLTLGALCGVSS